MNILVTWIGLNDLDAAAGENPRGAGPVASALDQLQFDQVMLLANLDDRITKQQVDSYKEWLVRRLPTIEHSISVQIIGLENPTHFASIYSGVDGLVSELKNNYTDEDIELTFHLSPGTSQMSSVWVLLSRTKHPATLIQSSPEAGVETVTLPFEISAELVPHLFENADSALIQRSATLAGGTLGNFTYESPVMQRLMRKALKVAVRSVPVLIEGEPGTEKAQLALLVHKGGQTTDQPFERLSCGATAASELIDQLFGSGSGGESGALERARGGTLYIEEIECLPPEAQAKLQHEIESSEGLDVRLIISSRKNLLELVTQGEFREELFYMLAVIVLKIPALRDRKGDLSCLLDHVLARINDQSQNELDFSPKKLSPAARNFLLQQSWPGNLHELESTLRRAVVWSDGDVVSEADIWDALLIPTSHSGWGNDLLGKPIEEGVDIQALISEVARHYISRAIEYSEGNKSQAAKLVGLPSYQTLTNWIKKYEL